MAETLPTPPTKIIVAKGGKQETFHIYIDMSELVQLMGWGVDRRILHVMSALRKPRRGIEGDPDVDFWYDATQILVDCDDILYAESVKKYEVPENWREAMPADIQTTA